MLITSATKIKDYMHCRSFYYDRYVQRAQQSKDTSAIVGTAVHKAIELYYTSGKNPLYILQRTIAQELNAAQENGDVIIYRQPYVEMVQSGAEYLNGYDFTRYSNGISEVKFSLPLTDSVTVNGVIDRITDDDIVIDYKTSSRQPKDLSNDVQFTLYTWAFLQLYGRMPSAVYWYHFRTQTAIAYNMADLDTKIRAIKNTCTAMDNDTFSDLPPGKCAQCLPWCIRNGK